MELGDSSLERLKNSLPGPADLIGVASALEKILSESVCQLQGWLRVYGKGRSKVGGTPSGAGQGWYTPPLAPNSSPPPPRCSPIAPSPLLPTTPFTFHGARPTELFPSLLAGRGHSPPPPLMDTGGMLPAIIFQMSSSHFYGILSDCVREPV